MRNGFLASAAALAIAGAAFAQPSAQDLGSMTYPQTINTSHTLSSGEVKWYTLTIPAVDRAASQWLDILTNGPVNLDTMIGLYDSAGTRINFDDDDGPPAGIGFSQLTFGLDVPARVDAAGAAALNGRDGAALAAGVYYLALTGFGGTVWGLTDWVVTSTHAINGQVNITINLGSNNDLRVTAAPADGVPGRTTLLTVQVNPGQNPASTNITARVDLSGIGGSATQALVDDGTNGDRTAGDGFYSYRYSLPAATPLGTVPLNVTAADAQTRTATGVIQLSVVAVGQLPDSAGTITDGTRIDGTLGPNQANMWSIFICDPANFGATTVGNATIDTQLFLFNADGLGIAVNDDSAGVLQSTLTNAFTSSLSPGQYFLAISQYNKDPRDAANNLIWISTPFASERAPDGPGAANSIAQWDAAGGAGGVYAILLTGVNATSCIDPCVADVDDGTFTGTPDGGVTIDDLLYYLFLFEAGDVRADVDNGTFTGTLDGGVTIDDLLYYIFRFEQGC